jgi:hypothetical protein
MNILMTILNLLIGPLVLSDFHLVPSQRGNQNVQKGKQKVPKEKPEGTKG